MFHLDLTRQFELLHDNGEHGRNVQFPCELLFEPAPIFAPPADRAGTRGLFLPVMGSVADGGGRFVSGVCAGEGS